MMRPRLTLSLFLVWLLGSGWTSGAASDPTAALHDGDPGRRVVLGVARPDGRDLVELDALSASLDGHTPAIWTIWSQWGSPLTREFPTSVAEGLAERGVIPMIWWEPVDPSALEDPTYARHRNISGGDHDEYIRRFARDAAAFGQPVLLRFAHEANGTYFPWSIERHGNSAGSFIAMWRHVHDLFTQEGAANVRFVWSVSQRRCRGGCDPYAPVFPGDRYVDVLGFSAHNWGAHRRRWVSLYDQSKRVAERLAGLSDKPLMLAEAGSNAEGGDKAAWITDGYREVYERLPRVTAIVYLDADLRSVGHPDWRLASPPAALAAFAEIAASPEFGTATATDWRSGGR